MGPKLAIWCFTAAALCRAGTPLYFEPNRGQAGADVRFLARTPGLTLLLQDFGVTTVMNCRDASGEIRMSLAGASMPQRFDGIDQQIGISNYLIGHDPARWRTGIPQFARVRAAGVYRGIDLVYYGNEGKLEYDFVIAPGADARRIRLGMRARGPCAWMQPAI